ncbi:MAG: DNA adenine methylase [Deltaproteobacteria bacterium]|jgi:DNA adenine methylase|nr:DNA adenine methylase [Deltaproteobacteria bacterium]
MPTKAALKKDPLVKPYLKWAGGKRQLLDEITKHLPEGFETLRYYEPFVGAGALFFHCQPHQAVINDNNEQLILTYKTIRSDVDQLIRTLRKHQKNNSEEYYYKLRGQDRDSIKFAEMPDVQKSARLIYLNKTCYNGLYRVNSKGLFNVPYGKYTNPSICDEAVLQAIHRYLNQENVNIDILTGDFEDAVEKAGKGSFIYFDPPYHSPDKTNFTGYLAGGFGEDKQSRLRDVFVARSKKGAKCLLSNSDTPFIRSLYSDDGFEIIEVKAKRFINSDSTGRGEVGEVLVKSWK